MDALHPIFAALCVAVAVAIAAGMEWQRPSPPPPSPRYQTIDGLRGYLAIFVFLHHASIWHGYLQTGSWQLPPSRFYTLVGQGSITLFFMITGFLFFSRLLEQRSRIDWLGLYASRVGRLAPLYLALLASVALIVLLLQGGTLVWSPGFSGDWANWLVFTMFGAPDLNAVRDTWVIHAGSLWPLAYEIAFYAVLPWLALLTGAAVPWPSLAAASLAVAWYFFGSVHVLVFSAFGAGIAAACIARWTPAREIAARPLASLAVLVCMAALACCFSSAYQPGAIGLLFVAFVFVGCGNSFGGVLLLSASRSLGSISYGLFLIHGVVLFTVFRFVLGIPLSRTLGTMQFWLVVTVICAAVVLVSYASRAVFEYPLQQRARRMATMVRGWPVRRVAISHLFRW
jgi:peptidoglycan/LPS O-acetylase OafA/YrhL